MKSFKAGAKILMVREGLVTSPFW